MTAPPSAQTTELTRNEKIFTLAGTMLGLLLAALDQTVVATAGPKMQKDLSIEAALYAWITTAYVLASTVLVPIWGKLSDLFGRKRILLVGIGVFLGGSLLCGVATSSLQLILFRAVQGIGAASLFTSAFAVIADIFPPAVRGRYTGLFGAVFGLSSVVGPLLGGFITDFFNWHWVFFINMPIGALAVAFIALKMPPLAARGKGPVSIDLPGAVTLIIGSVSLLLALSFGRAHGSMDQLGWPWMSWQILSLLGLAAVSLTAFLRIEKRGRDPIIDLSLFNDRVFAIGNLAAFVLGAGFLAAMVFIPLFMVNVVGLSNTRSGLTTMPLTFGIVFGNIISGQIVSRTGRYKPLMLAAIALLTLGYAVMGFTLSTESTQAEVTVKMVLVGLGLGPSIPLYTLAIQNAVPITRMGVATSTATFFRSMGSTLGIAVVGTVFATVLAGQMTARLESLTHELPPAVRALLDSGGSARGSNEEGVTAMQFNREAVRQRVSETFAQRRAAAGGDEGTRAALDAAERGALEAVDRVDGAVKSAFTVAVRTIYQLAILIGVLGFTLTLFLPERPLRKSNREEPAPAH